MQEQADARHLLTVLLCAQVLLSVSYAAAEISGRTVEMLDLDGEANVPAWWGATLLALIGAFCLLIGTVTPAAGARWPWVVVGGGFGFLSLDEVTQLHERVGSAMGDEGGTRSLWVLAYLPLLLLGATALLRVTRSVGRRPRYLMRAGLVAMAMAVMAEAISGALTDLRNPVQVLVEENAEMLGSGLILTAVVTTLIDGLRDGASGGGDGLPVDDPPAASPISG